MDTLLVFNEVMRGREIGCNCLNGREQINCEEDKQRGRKECE